MNRASLFFTMVATNAGPRWTGTQTLPALSAVSNRIAIYTITSFVYMEGGAGIAENVTDKSFLHFIKTQTGITNTGGNEGLVYVPAGYAGSCAPFFWTQNFTLAVTVTKQGLVIVPTAIAAILLIDYENK